MNLTYNQISSALKLAGARLPKAVQALGDHCELITRLKDKERSIDADLAKSLSDAQYAAAEGDYQAVETHFAKAKQLRAARAAIPREIEDAVHAAPKLMAPIVDAINASIVLEPLLGAVLKELPEMSPEAVRRIMGACPQLSFLR